MSNIYIQEPPALGKVSLVSYVKIILRRAHGSILGFITRPNPSNFGATDFVLQITGVAQNDGWRDRHRAMDQGGTQGLPQLHTTLYGRVLQR